MRKMRSIRSLLHPDHPKGWALNQALVTHIHWMINISFQVHTATRAFI